MIKLGFLISRLPSEKILVKRLFFVVTLLFSCVFQVACANDSSLISEPIDKIAEKDNIKFGFAVLYDPLKTDTEYQNIVKSNASVIVPTNALKWNRTQPSQNQYNFQKSDYIINYAVVNNMQARGHTLVWHQGIPQYVLNEKDPEKVEKLLRDHITTVVTRYKGKISSWDVVNEVINIPDGQPNGLRNSYWYQVLGEKYIDIAFDAAYKADPKAILLYNEWGTEYNRDYSIAKRKAVIDLVKRLQSRNIPISGFGIQGHITTNGANYIDETLTQFIQELKSLGLKVYVTELDVAQSKNTSTDTKQYTVPETYNKFINYALKSNAIEDVLIWGVFNQSNPNDNSKIPFYLFDKGTGCNSNCIAVKESFITDGKN
ncbi:hypothetical protein B9T31_16910 [Acinetobacter sp. ANC 4558]|uniref:endo-1,4-beta-xylanase n=1 Tax=Acinetobacter sp. ANC 4558 TaxID=1977876 RepID=UPI000A337A23|nr:endo-1,4-beta-xylanase [Acinetobacter sp. ANC 4558]OTG79569.1 hypothetical protein B9T31_16910 [Acinetobacter sp. ANC 4558]